MHVALINTDGDIWSLGMRSISSALRQAGYSTTMIFARLPPASIDKSVIEALAGLLDDSDIIGISSMAFGAPRAKKLIERLHYLKKPIVWGGIYPTIFPADCINYADIICRGEGEEFMIELAERIASGRSFTDIQNGVYRENGNIIYNHLRPPIPIEKLPVPDFSFENEYILDYGEKRPLLFRNAEMRYQEKIFIGGSRGCANSCAFCSNSALNRIYKGNGRYVRKIPIPRFIQIAKKYKEIFPRANKFLFTDEDFFAHSIEELKQFALMYPVEVGIPFECTVSPPQTTKEKVALAFMAGVCQIDIGLESCSERVRKHVFNRYIDNATQKKASDNIHAFPDIMAEYFLIVGNPYESKEDLINGIHFLTELLPPFYLRPFNLVFLPGTNLYERAFTDGIIKGVINSSSDNSFMELDFFAQDWKRKNLYLNSLFSMMYGKSTNVLIGFIPRQLIPFLLNRRIVTFFDRHSRISEIVAAAVRTSVAFRLRTQPMSRQPAERALVLARIRLKKALNTNQ